MDATSYDVVIIGAGVQGPSCAYHIALGGRVSVLVLERRERPGQGSSGRSGSMLMKSRENPPKIALSLYSYSRFMNFEEEFGEPFTFRKTGFLSLVPPSVSTRYEAEHRLRLAMGVPSERLSPYEIKQLAPGLLVEGLAFGVLCPDDGEIDAHQIMRAYERRGRELGVAYRFSAPVTAILCENGRVMGVTTPTGRINCGMVVNAAGAEAAIIASQVGLDLPILNRRRSLYYVACEDPAFASGPMIEDAELEWYYRALGDGRVLLGMGLEPDREESDGPNMEFLPEVRRATRRRAPGLADLPVIGGSSGIRPLTPDILPIIGPVERPAGYIDCCGWRGEGIMHSPAGGALVADCINGTSDCSIALEPFRRSREITATTRAV